MAYIDREKFLKSTISRFKCVPLIGVPKTINGEECFDGEDLQQALNQAPAEDVVPRSEVVRLQIDKENLEQSEKYWKDKCKRHEMYCDELMKKLEKAKQEVAREIFEEIEKAHDDCIVIGTNDVGYLQVCKFEQILAELKKKYIGE